MAGSDNILDYVQHDPKGCKIGLGASGAECTCGLDEVIALYQELFQHPDFQDFERWKKLWKKLVTGVNPNAMGNAESGRRSATEARLP